MKCPAGKMDQAKVRRSTTLLDTVDVECLSCATFGVSGPEQLDLDEFTTPSAQS